jgi:hypothetical protein
MYVVQPPPSYSLTRRRGVADVIFVTPPQLCFFGGQSCGFWRPFTSFIGMLQSAPSHQHLAQWLAPSFDGSPSNLVVLVAYRSSLRRFWAYLVPFSQQCLHMSSLPSPRTLTAKSITLALILLAAVRCVNLVLEAFDESFV